MRIAIPTLLFVLTTSLVSAQEAAKKAGAIQPAAVTLGRPV